MRIIKYLFGTLCALYALVAAFGIISNLAFGHIDFGAPHVDSEFLGAVAAICISTAIAVICFRPKKS
jgi:predicted outer membrane lipoprotein